MIILDFGHGQVCRNDKKYVKKMIDNIPISKEEILIKWQLFEDIPGLASLKTDVFDYAFWYARKRGYPTTASVFDVNSLALLLTYPIEYVKITVSLRHGCEALINMIPKSIRILVSVSSCEQRNRIKEKYKDRMIEFLYCVPKYPATETEYRALFYGNLSCGISDHTVGFGLYKRYQPIIYECHYKLEDSIGIDAGPWAKTPKELKEIL